MRRSTGPAFGPTVSEQGYYVGRVEGNLYRVTDGIYQSAFLTTCDGVVLFDAPPTIGHNIQRAVDEIAAANGVSNKVTHLIYSHHHADHAGASSLFDRNITRIGHEETRKLLLRDDDPARPAPEETFQDRRTLEIGGERIELAWHGSNHSPDNIFIHLPDHAALMLVDIVNPGWAAVCQSNLADDVPGYIEAADTALTYPWKHFIGGHMGRLGTRDDIATHRQYMADIADSSRKALDTVDPTPYFVKHGENTWAAMRELSGRDHGRRRGAGHREVHRRSCRPRTSSLPAPPSTSCNRSASTWVTVRRFTPEPGDPAPARTMGFLDAIWARRSSEWLEGKAPNSPMNITVPGTHAITHPHRWCSERFNGHQSGPGFRR